MTFKVCGARTAVVVALVGIFLGGAASADEPEVFYNSDFSDFQADFFKTSSLALEQNPTTATVRGTKGYNAFESRGLIGFDDISMSGGIFYKQELLVGDMVVKVLYFDEAKTLLGKETIFENPHGGINLQLVRNLNPTPGATQFRFQFRLDGPSGIAIPGTLATLDNLSVTSAPEPGTAALLGTGLVGLGWVGRRRRA